MADMNEGEGLTTCGVAEGTPEEIESREETLEMSKLAKGEFDVGDFPYIIPLVFHVIHKGEPYGVGSNMKDTQIHAAVTSLNKDYSRQLDSFGYGDGVNTSFRFMIANKDDNGNPTTGINRIDGGALSQVYFDEGLHGVIYGKGESENTITSWSKWDKNRVCNIWVVWAFDDNGGGSGVQGQSRIPSSYLNTSDGIDLIFNTLGLRRIDNVYGSEGTFYLKIYTDLGKTLTHEMGHYLGLYHTFQGNSCTETNCAQQGDYVCDTPPTIKSSNGQFPACNGTQQVANYMDYTPQAYKRMLTNGQNNRMVAAVEAFRSSLLTSDALSNLSTIDADLSIEIITPSVCCSGSTQYLKVRIINTSENIIHKIDLSYNTGEGVEFFTWYGALAKQSLSVDDVFAMAILPTDHTRTTVANVISINGNAKSISTTKEIIIPTNPSYKVKFSQDVSASEISWKIKDRDSDEVLYISPPYDNFHQNTVIESQICLPNGNYRFTVMDSQNDGINDYQAPGAYIKLIDSDNDDIFVINVATGAFSELFYDFSIPSNLNNDTFIGEINHVGHYDFAMDSTQVSELNAFLTTEHEL